MIAFVVTAFTLIAFAANSLLCRMALGGGLIDPVSFTTIRLLSGAIALIPLSRLFAEPKASGEAKGSWMSGLSLFAYAAAFSLAYVTLTTGTGALILFGAVQVTMMSVALKSGERMGFVKWSGLAMSVGGLVYLLSPGITAPDPLGAVLMGVAGVAWSVYSVRGKGTRTPIAMTAGNFLRAAPMALLASVAAFSTQHLQWPGIILGLISGVDHLGTGLRPLVHRHAQPHHQPGLRYTITGPRGRRHRRRPLPFRTIFPAPVGSQFPDTRRHRHQHHPPGQDQITSDRTTMIR